VSIERRWSRPDRHPFDEVVWEERRSVITDEKGKVIFETPRVEVPAGWSQLATDIAASKYLRKAGVPGAGCETSVKQLITRVARTIRDAGEQLGGYFADPEAGAAFEAELTALLVSQRAAFNSPVWFNCGLYHHYGIAGSGGNWYWEPRTERLRAPAVVGLFHPVRGRRSDVDLRSREARGAHFQIRLRQRDQFFPAAGPAGKALRRRHVIGVDVVSGGLRPGGRLDQIWRHDPPGGEDGLPGRGPSGDSRFYRLEDARGAQGAGADRGRLPVRF
jgi:hypothetical protein